MRLSRATLLTLGILLASNFLSGCRSFTLVGNLNVGGGAGPENAPATSANLENSACWPTKAAMMAEITHKGFTPKSWPETEKFFAALVPVSRMHPVCQ